MVILSLTSIQLTGYAQQKNECSSLPYRAGEMVQWENCLLCSHEVPRLNPQIPAKPSVTQPKSFLNPSSLRARWQAGRSPVKRDPASRRLPHTRWEQGLIPDTVLTSRCTPFDVHIEAGSPSFPPPPPMCMCAYTHTHTRTRTHTYTHMHTHTLYVYIGNNHILKIKRMAWSILIHTHF